MALFKRHPKSTDAVAAVIARAEWRAQLHELNGDDAGAALQRQYASETRMFSVAKIARKNPDDPNYLEAVSRYQGFRKQWRDIRTLFPRGAEVQRVMTELQEPSDEDLLA